MTGTRRRRCKQLLDYLETGYLTLKEKALDNIVWRTCCGRGCGPVVRLLNE